MTCKDSIKISGSVKIEIINIKTKKIIDTKFYTNILVRNGLKMIRGWLANVNFIADPDYNVDTRVTHMALGDDNTTPDISQNALGNELLRKELFPTPAVNCEINLNGDYSVDYVFFLDQTELNGETIREIGIFSETYTNFMISRLLVGNLTKSSSVDFKITYTFTVTG